MIFPNVPWIVLGLLIGLVYVPLTRRDTKPEPAMACCFPNSTDEACLRGRAFLQTQSLTGPDPASAPLSSETP